MQVCHPLIRKKKKKTMMPGMPLTILLAISIVETVHGGPVHDPCSCRYGQKGYWCAHGHFCIPKRKVCDYSNDCGDAQDEKSCDETCYLKHTPSNDGGRGDARYLDRHNVCCHGNVLKGFRLHAGNGKINYGYTCCHLKQNNICRSERKYTPYNDNGRGNTVYLDRHRVDCGNYGYLQRFRLVVEPNNWNGRYRYDYDCCMLQRKSHKKRTTCYETRTNLQTEGHGNNIYLDRHGLKCKDRYFLSMFQLRRRVGGGYYQYVYRCCRIQ